MTIDDDFIPPMHPSLSDTFAANKMKELRREQKRREMEGLRLYEPLPVQDAFHSSRVLERVLRGSNRGGKTTPACVEIARAVTNQDPYNKYPSKDGRCICVAKSQKEIGEVFYPKLFQKGAFKVIKDKQTGKWRAYRPWMPEDKKRRNEVKLSQALIPRRLIDRTAWEDRAKNVPNLVRLKNGWTILFFTANSPPPQGVDVDVAWFDEEVTGQGWYSEIAARLVDRRGLFVWSATPQNATQDLFDLSQRAADPEDPQVEEFFIKLDDNLHIDEVDKQNLKNKYRFKPEEYKVRIEGEFALLGHRVYPRFSKHLDMHGCEIETITGRNIHGELVDEKQEAMWQTRFNHYMVVDPGRQVCAVGFFAVPPPEFPFRGQRFLYDELYITECTANRFASAVKRKVENHYFMEFLIDPSSARTDIATATTVLGQYADALEAVGVASYRTQSGFALASNSRMAGIERTSSWMDIQPEMMTPKLKVVTTHCPNFLWEIERYNRRKVAGILIDEPNDRNDHMMDALRYFCMRDPLWQEPPPAPRPESYIALMMKKFQRFSPATDEGTYHNFGPREYEASQ